MKVRSGFVSNSSSSSFIIIGVSDDTLMEQIAVEDGKFSDGEYKNIECGYGVDSGKVINYYGYWGEPQYIGIDIAKKLENQILPELRKEFKDKIKKEFNLNIPLSKIKLYYGEVGE